MSWRFCLILFIGILLEWKLTHSAPAAENGKIKDKGRAYEFGFSIEEQQHRHEKRDENGIVMGEFGFITADGIYHVTVYATDENGKFKIISMKNYPYGNPEKKIMIATLPPAKKPVVTPTVIKAMKPDGKSCGGCVLPKKSNLLPADVMGKKKPNDEMVVFRPLSKALNDVSSNGKPDGGADKVSMSSPANQPKSSSMTTGSLPQDGDAQIPLIDPRFSTSDSKKPNAIGTTSSKVGPKTSTNNGNIYHITNSITQTTQTPTRFYTKVPDGTNTTKQINTRFGGETQFSRIGSSVPPTRYSNSLTSFNSQQALDYKLNYKSSKHVTKSSTNNTNLNNTPQKLNRSPSKTTPSHLQFFGNQIPLEKNTNDPEIPSKIDKVFGSPSPDSKFPIKTGRKPSLTGGSQTKKLLNPNIASNIPVKQNVPKEFGLFGQEKPVIENSKPTGRNPLSISTKHSRPSPTFGNPHKLYITDSVKTKNQTKSFGLPIYDTNTTPQHFPNSLKQTNLTPHFKQFPRNDRNKPKISNLIGISSQENQFDPTLYEDKKNFPQVGRSSQTNKFPNPIITSTIPFDVPKRFNTKTQSLSSSVIPSYNPIKSFALPANNRKTSLSQQQGPTNTFTQQNAVKPTLKSTKEPKPFQTLSKFLPDENGSKQSGVPISGKILPQTSTLTPSEPRKTLLQNSGQGPPLVTASPQSIGKNTLTQPKLTAKTSTPKTLQQNTNGAKTSTTNSQSTKNKQTPAAPSPQPLGKTTSTTNSGGVGASSSSGNVGVGDGGGGPLYRFKYVLDYNSHREEGHIDGTKEGKYNTIDDDGVRRIIDYIANENGYQPHIKLERPPPNELPTGENKLKEYEFVWFN